MINIKEEYDDFDFEDYDDIDKECCYIYTEIKVTIPEYFKRLITLPDNVIEHELDDLDDSITANINKCLNDFKFISDLDSVEIDFDDSCLNIYIKNAGTVEVDTYTERPTEYARYRETYRDIDEDSAEFEINNTNVEELVMSWLPRKFRFDEYDIDVKLNYISNICFI